LRKALKKLTNVKKLKKKNYTKKRGKLYRSIGKDWTQFRARKRMSSSVDRSRRRARVRISLTRACVHG